MSAADAATVALAIIAGVGVLAAIVRWFYNRGGAEKQFTIALKQNTEATKELSTAFHSFRDDVVGEIHSLDVRVTKIEAASNASPPPHRDPSPA